MIHSDGKLRAFHNFLRDELRMNTIKFLDMTSGSFAFLWVKAEEGYQLEDENKYKLVSELIPSDSIYERDPAKPLHTGPPWLVPKGEMSQRYAPLAISVLHRKFARLFDKDSIREFADRYGLLGNPVPLGPKGGGTWVLGESLEHWYKESHELGILLVIWDMVKKQDAGKLGQIIVWPSGNRVILRIKTVFDKKHKEWQILDWGDGKPASPQSIEADHLLAMRGKTNIEISTYLLAMRGKTNSNPELLDRWKTYDVIEPARYFVCREVNQRLKGHISPQVLPFLGSKIYLFPDSLLSAMWLMLFNEITGALNLRRCDNCGEWKQVLKERKTFFCSARCRQAKHRIRLKEKEGRP
jgi:hypothetical protein